MRRTQPDFSSVLPTVVLALPALSGTRLENQRSLGAARGFSKRRDRLRLLQSPSMSRALALSSPRQLLSSTPLLSHIERDQCSRKALDTPGDQLLKRGRGLFRRYRN